MVMSISNLNFNQLYNVAKYKVNPTENTSHHFSQGSNQNSQKVSILSQDEAYDVIQMSNTNTYLKDAYDSGDENQMKQEAETWKSIFDRNQRLQGPMESLDVYKKLVAADAYKVA